jgi:hypothetical protein
MLRRVIQLPSFQQCTFDFASINDRKMEMVISAPHAGKIDKIDVSEGVFSIILHKTNCKDSVNSQDLIAKIIKEE